MCTCQTRSLSGLGLLMWAGYHLEPSSILLPVLFDPKKIYTTFSWLNRGIKKREEEIPGEKSSHFILPGYVQFRYPLNDRIARITFKDESNSHTMHMPSIFSTPGFVNETLWTERAIEGCKRYWKGWEKLLNSSNTDQTCLGYMHAKHMPGGMQRPWIESIGGFFFFHFFPFLDS